MEQVGNGPQIIYLVRFTNCLYHLLTGEIDLQNTKTIKAEYEKKMERLDCTISNSQAIRQY